jgi:hypothetical protein
VPAELRPAPLRYRVAMASIRRTGEYSRSPSTAGEAVRIQRLHDDARRPMSVNLAEGIALSHKLIKFAGAARRH